MICYFIIDEAGNWVATDKDGNRLPTPEAPEAREDRFAAALESIAESLKKIANPLRMVSPDGTVRQIDDVLAEYLKKADKSPGAVNYVPVDHPILGGLRESGPA